MIEHTNNSFSISAYFTCLTLCQAHSKYYSFILLSLDVPFSGYTSRTGRPGFTQPWQVYMCVCVWSTVCACISYATVCVCDSVHVYTLVHVNYCHDNLHISPSSLQMFSRHRFQFTRPRPATVAVARLY